MVSGNAPPPSFTVRLWSAISRGGLTPSCPLSHMSKTQPTCCVQCHEAAEAGDFQEDVRSLLSGTNEEISLPCSPTEAR